MSKSKSVFENFLATGVLVFSCFSDASLSLELVMEEAEEVEELIESAFRDEVLLGMTLCGT